MRDFCGAERIEPLASRCERGVSPTGATAPYLQIQILLITALSEGVKNLMQTLTFLITSIGI